MVELEFIPRGSGDTLTIPDRDIQNLNATLTNTGVGTFRAKISGDRRLEGRASGQNRVNVNHDGETHFAGFLTNCAQARQEGTTSVRGKGIFKKLQETRPDYQANGGPIVYDNIFAGDAIEDYWSRTPFGNVTVTKQPSNVVVQDSLTQSADTQTEWQDILSIPHDVPAYIDNGKLKQAQSGFVSDRNGGATDVNYSSGEAQRVELETQSFSINFTAEYDISNLEFYVRSEEIQQQSGEFTVLEVSLDGGFEGRFTPPGTIGWESIGLSNISAGNHTVTVAPENVQGLSYGISDLDVFAVVDAQYSYTFDNTVDSDNGHLDGPALYPTDAKPVVTTDATTTTRNITEANITTTYNNTSNDQRIGASDDGGTDFIRVSNSNSLSANFANNAGRELVTEFRLSGYDSGARNATPRFNYLGQEIDSFETKVDLDDRVVFVGVEVSKNHFENLQKLHDNSDYVFTNDHDSSDVATMPVFSFPRGEETRSSGVINDNEIDESPEVSGEQFYNTIPLQGGLDNQGNRPFAEVEDTDSINDVGEEISPGLLRDPTISSDVEAQFIAQALLKKALQNGELRGQKTVPPTFRPIPGFAYPVSWLNDDRVERTLEEVSITKSTNSAQTVLDFTGRTGFAQEIDNLRRQARETQDEV